MLFIWTNITHIFMSPNRREGGILVFGADPVNASVALFPMLSSEPAERF